MKTPIPGQRRRPEQAGILSALVGSCWLLVLTAVKMVVTPEMTVDPSRNRMIRLLRRLVPVTPGLHGQRFFVRLGPRLHATPLLVALVFLEMTDVVFALDSVPAIFALTREPFIVFTSNIFAILGLRALYFLLSGAVEKFHLLKYGLAAVLAFVGLKMVWLNGAFDGKFPIVWSLAIIAGAVFAAIVASLAFPRRSATATPTVSEPPAHPLAGRPR